MEKENEIKEKIKKRMNEKMEQVEEFLEQLASAVPETIEEYESSWEKKAICERLAQKIVEGVTDISFYVINLKNLTRPVNEEGVFLILAKNEIISEELSKRLSEARGMRNFIIHEYGEIDDSIVFSAVSEELQKDVGEFLDAVRRGK